MATVKAEIHKNTYNVIPIFLLEVCKYVYDVSDPGLDDLEVGGVRLLLLDLLTCTRIYVKY